MESSDLQFDGNSPFVDMVGTFMVAICSCQAIFDPKNPLGISDADYISITGVNSAGKHIRPYETFINAQDGHITIQTFLKNCCLMLANTAYERVKNLNDRSPIFEFLRHVRNACSHGNAFHFTGNEPRYLAEWRNIRLDASMEGSECFGLLLGPTDIIDLLFDIDTRIRNFNADRK